MVSGTILPLVVAPVSADPEASRWELADEVGILWDVSGEVTFWDRATLYALRGVFAAGDTDRAVAYLSAYTRRRLLGEHVPYPVEAYPEGGQRHLSAESARHCRAITEGLFGITPTGLLSFSCAPRLPEAWDRMALRSVRAFGTDFDLLVERGGAALQVSITREGAILWRTEWDGDVERPVEVDVSALR